MDQEISQDEEFVKNKSAMLQDLQVKVRQYNPDPCKCCGYGYWKKEALTWNMKLQQQDKPQINPGYWFWFKI